MAVQYSVALGGFRRLVSEDERFAIPAAAGASASTPRASAADQEAKRAARRARRQDKR